MDGMLDAIDSILPDGWERDGDIYGMDFNLVCPHGRMIEQDGWHEITPEEAADDPANGKAGSKCVSPMRTMGLI